MLAGMCDSFVTVTDEGLMFAKNSDRDPNEAQLLEWIPAADHPGDDRVNCTWIDVPQVPHTHAVLVSRPWWMWGAEMGANEHGVVVGNEAVFTNTTSSTKALLGMDLVRLALERAANAEQAVDCMVELLERYGQGGPCSYDHPGFSYDSSFLIADPGAAWVLETAGSSWSSEEVRGPARSISNSLTIPDFARAHTDRLRGWAASAATRRRRTEVAACRARGPGDLMCALRDHADPASPHWSLIHGGLGAPCVHAGGPIVSSQTTASWVSDLRCSAGAGSSILHWATATSAPCTSLFKPVALDQPVNLGLESTNVFNAGSVWWRHELLHRATMGAYSTLSPRYEAQRDMIEKRWIADPPSSQEAFEQADRLEKRWFDDVAGARLEDTRPYWIRRTWRSANKAARMTSELFR